MDPELRVRIFHRPARTIEVDVEVDEDEWSVAQKRLPELSVVLDKQIPWWPWAKRGSGGVYGDPGRGRARVIDTWILLVDEQPKAYGARKFVMSEAHREACLDEYDRLPEHMVGTRRERYKALRWQQRENDRRWGRKSNRRRKRRAMWLKHIIAPVVIDVTVCRVFRDALYPSLLFRMEQDPAEAARLVGSIGNPIPPK